MRRREVLKSIGLTAGLASLPVAGFTAVPQEHPLGSPPDFQRRRPARPVTVAVMGAGGRGNTYAAYAQEHPEELKIVGVAEPIPARNLVMAARHGIPDSRRWDTWERTFEQPKFCDAILVTTPDHLHYGPAMAALEKGYDLLIEKVVAQSWQECNDILSLSRKAGRIVAVCHVLRYAPYFRQMRHVVRSGYLGRPVSIQHLEPVGNIHMSHSFVRGNWGNSQRSNPMILSKSCHDLDLLRWILDLPCLRISSFGSLTHFRAEDAPPGSTARCTDPCPVEKDCPYSALRIYQREGLWGTHHLNLADDRPESLVAALRSGPYGRCVYRCDNDVVDHQIVNMEFAGGVTVTFSMEALTSYSGRRTRIMGTEGDLIGDEETLRVRRFKAETPVVWDVRQDAPNASGHGGGDAGLIRDFVQAVSRSDPGLLTSTLEASMESHLMGFLAEKSRLEGGSVQLVKL